jgi:hypothetical protein
MRATNSIDFLLPDPDSWMLGQQTLYNVRCTLFTSVIKTYLILIKVVSGDSK